MFKGGQTNPYDEAVAQTTDENLTGENWELIMVLCDKVQDEGEKGARSVMAALLRRLAHRNPNVQLYSLSVAESLSKNCGITVHREIASRSFTQCLERLVTDRTSHDKVRKRALELIHMWVVDFEKDPTLGIMEECFENLKSKGYKYDEPNEPPPPQVDDEIRRREEEELQRVLEMSVRDKGGRAAWQSYSSGPQGQSSSAAPSSSSYSAEPSSSTDYDTTAKYGGPPYAGGYAPQRTPSPRAQTLYNASSNGQTYSASSPVQNNSSQTSLPLTYASRVRALHTFEGTEQGELTFDKGDIIKVVDRNYKDWWRGQLRGRTGIFPVNYVELLPDPTPEEVAKEAEQEAAVFAQAANIDKLLSMLRGLDSSRDSLADNDEIQELYRLSVSLRPKIVKLIDKYSQKKAELISMNESFVKARTMFDRMMEESLARHSGIYDRQPSYPGVQPDYRASAYVPAYDQGYAAFPQAQATYNVSSPTPAPHSHPYGPQQAPYQQQQPYQAPPQPAGPYTPQQDALTSYPGYGPPQLGQSQFGPPGPYTQQSDPQLAIQQAQPAPYAQQNGQAQPPMQGPSSQPQATEFADQPRQITEGPPYVYDPKATYSDANAQAWAQYYAEGGTDPTGAIYFISVPGVKEAPVQPVQPPQPSPPVQQVQPQQPQQLQQPQLPLNAFEEKRLLAEKAAQQQNQSPTEEAVPAYQASAQPGSSLGGYQPNTSYPLPPAQPPAFSGSSSSLPLGSQQPLPHFSSMSGGSGGGGSPTSQRTAMAPPSHQPFVPTSPTLSSPTHGGSANAHSPITTGYPLPAQPAQQQGIYSSPYTSPSPDPQFGQMQAQFAGMEVAGEGHAPPATQTV